MFVGKAQGLILLHVSEGAVYACALALQWYVCVCVADPVIPYSCLPVERWAMTLFSIVYPERTCFIW